MQQPYRNGVGSVDIAYIGNVCDEVTPLSQGLKAATCCITVLAHLHQGYVRMVSKTTLTR